MEIHLYSRGRDMEPGTTSTDLAILSDLLHKSASGDRKALDRAVQLLYKDLLRLARAQRVRWQGEASLDTTALCHEAYLKIAHADGRAWTSRSHFLSVVARAMRQILIDHARARKAAKRGGGAPRVPVSEVEELLPEDGTLTPERADTLLLLERALEALELESPRHARIVECRFFAGMTIRETADALGLSTTSIKRGWRFAQAWLYEWLSVSGRASRAQSGGPGASRSTG